MSAMEFVYTLRDELGRPIYVGRSRDVARRIRVHYWQRDRKPWILDVRDVTMSGPYDHATAVWVENCRIADVCPPANKACNGAYSAVIPGFDGGRYAVAEQEQARSFRLDEDRPYVDDTAPTP